MRIKYRDAENLLNKLKFDPPRQTHHKRYKFRYGGKTILTAYHSHGSGEMKATDKFRIDLKLNPQQFRDAIQCTLNYDEYVEILKSKKII
mgnify:FL=1